MARVLEALSANALSVVGMKASENAFSNLDTLEKYSLLTMGSLYSAHALRRLGNKARHIQEELTVEHAELALALTEQVLQWFFFLELPNKPAVDRLCRDERCLQLATDVALREALTEAELVGRTWPSGWAELPEQQRTALLRTPQPAAIVAEMWQDRGRDMAKAAGDLLRDALAFDRLRNDLRLRQLHSLALSRNGELEKARDKIEELRPSDSDDEETVGIAAGIYKRIWQREPEAKQPLAKSHKLYLKGWKKSKQASAYLGINAATTALWLGKPDESRQLATDVAKLLSGRAERLQQCGCADIRADYWTQASLAEALLLQGQLPPAAAAYRTAFEQYPDNQGDFRVTRTQLQAIAQALSIPQKDIEPLLK